MATEPKLHHFVLSDLHFGHKRIVDYSRTQFTSIDEHDQHIINCINTVCHKDDYLWLLGDIGFTKPALEKLQDINCRMALIGGNHDCFSASRYLTHFEQFRGIVTAKFAAYGDILFSHVPMHSAQKRWAYNVHGHNHVDLIEDSRYINVTCEYLDYTPARIHSLLAQRKLKEYLENGADLHSLPNC